MTKEPTSRGDGPPAPARGADADRALVRQLDLAGRVMKVMQAQLDRASRALAELEGASGRAETAARALDTRAIVAPAPPRPGSPEEPASEDARALHALIDDLVGRCAVLEREKAEAAAGERDLLAGLLEELRAGLAEATAAIEGARLDARQRAACEPARATLEGLVELVGGVRAMSPGDASPAGEPFDVRDALLGAAEQAARRAEEKSIELTSAVAPDVPPTVVGDRAALRHATLGVAQAAVRLAERGSITLEATLDAGAPDHVAIRVRVAHEGAPARAAQSDAGEGLPGLAVTRRLVERLGGRLGVEVEEGARFALWFTARLERPDRLSADRRTHNRLRVVDVESSVGPVLELSLGGARVRSRRKLQGRLELEIRAAGDTVRVDAEVVWSRRMGWRNFESALRLLDVDPERARTLTRLSLEHRVRAMLSGDG